METILLIILSIIICGLIGIISYYQTRISFLEECVADYKKLIEDHIKDRKRLFNVK